MRVWGIVGIPWEEMWAWLGWGEGVSTGCGGEGGGRWLSWGGTPGTPEKCFGWGGLYWPGFEREWTGGKYDS